MTGYVKPDRFTAMFRFIDDEAYEDRTFKEYLDAEGSS
jgi:thioredoxin-related protein